MQLLRFRYTEIILMIITVIGFTMGSLADTQFVGNVYIDGNLVITNGGGAALVSGDTSAYLRVYGYGTSEVSGAAASIEGFNDGWAESASYGSVIEGCNEGDATVGSLAAGSRIEGYNAGWAAVVFPGSKEQGYNLGMRDVIGRGIVIGGYNSSGGDQLASGNGSTIDGYNLGSNLVTGSGSSIEGYTAAGAAQISGGTTGEAGGTKTAGMVKSGYTNLASANGAWAVGSDVHATNEYSYVFGDGRRSYRSNSLSVENIDVDTLYGSDGNPIDVASIANAGLTTNAAELTSGTLDDERLSENVILFSDCPDFDTDASDDLLLSGGQITGNLGVSSNLAIGGKVGIGLSNPATSLEVYNGSAWFHTAGGGAQTNVKLGEFTSTPSTALYEIQTDDVSGDALIFKCNRWGPKVYFRRETAYGEKNMAVIVGTAGEGSSFRLYGDDTNNIVLTYIRAQGNSYFLGGNVGVGIDTPSQKLSVAGTIESTAGGIKFPDGSVQTTSATNSLAGYVSKTGDTITGSLTVSGAVYMAYVPKQGDISMGVYTNGMP